MEVPFTGYKRGGDSPVGAMDKRGETVTLTLKIQVLDKLPSYIINLLFTLFIYFLSSFIHMNHEILNMAQKHCNDQQYNIVILMPGFFIP